ncbi:MAG: PQQ-dependent sugar dehydrogenase [Actinomycetota bacterium]
MKRTVLNKARGLSVTAVVLLGVIVFGPSAVAHPPDDPFDDTIFAPIGPGGFPMRLETTATGLTAPLKGVVAPGQPSRIYVVDQPGVVWAIDLGTGAKSVFLDVTSRIVTLGVFGSGTFDERGLLGLAFHPDYATNGRVYTYTSEPEAGPPTFATTLPPGTPPDHQNVVAEWRVPDPADPASVVDPASRRELIRVDWPQFNHDGGDLAFGPDGMLYVSMGDGGGADDQGVGHVGPIGNAQVLTNPLGKIHRIDVDGSDSANGQYGIPADNPFVGTPGAVKEIFAFGFRNPYRFSFDRATGNLFVGDAGQNDLEEVDLVVRGGNHGWATKEGTLFFFNNGEAEGFASRTDNGLVPPGVIDPIAQYDTHHEGHAVVGGFVYRGSESPQLRGRYVFGDFARLFRFPSGPNDTGRLFVLQQKNPTTGLRKINEFHLPGQGGLGRQNLEGTEEGIGLALLGFGQDAAGELYVLGNINGTPFGTDGVVLRLATPK